MGRRYRFYFPGHAIVVRSNLPLRDVTKKGKSSRKRLSKWCIKLGKYYVTYEHRGAVSIQVLADCIAEIPKEGKAGTNKGDRVKVDPE